MKREAGDEPIGQKHHKKHKHSKDRQDHKNGTDHHRQDRTERQQQRASGNNDHHNGGSSPPKKQNSTHTHAEALANLPPSTAASPTVPAYIPFSVPRGLPPLPNIKAGPLETAPFKHKSLVTYDRNVSTADITYERLEFLGDAYIELIASRLIFERYPTLTAGQQSQLRELLVKNETLAEYSRAYGFEARIEHADKAKMMEGARQKGLVVGNKGVNKVMGDVFEAYVAAVVLSDVEEGFAVAEAWLTALWAPKLLERAPRAKGPGLVTSDEADPLETYDPKAKAKLQQRICSGDVKLVYERYQDSVELKGAQLGESRHFIAAYLTGHGYERKLLAKGEGRNKVEAGNWAAQNAMFGENKELVDECEVKVKEAKEKRRKEQEAADAQAAASSK